MTNKENKTAYIEAINKHLKRCTVKQLHTVLIILYELTKGADEEDEA